MYLNKQQAAKMFGVSVSTVNNYMRLGMPFLKIGAGKLVRFEREKIEAWLMEKGRTNES